MHAPAGGVAIGHGTGSWHSEVPPGDRRDVAAPDVAAPDVAAPDPLLSACTTDCP